MLCTKHAGTNGVLPISQCSVVDISRHGNLLRNQLLPQTPSELTAGHFEVKNISRHHNVAYKYIVEFVSDHLT